MPRFYGERDETGATVELAKRQLAAKKARDRQAGVLSLKNKTNDKNQAQAETIWDTPSKVLAKTQVRDTKAKDRITQNLEQLRPGVTSRPNRDKRRNKIIEA